MNIIVQAASFAEFAHRGQLRKYSLLPYITHPNRVGGRAAVYGVDAACAGHLHDIVEDTSYSLDMIESIFGKKISKLVFELTSHSKLLKSSGNRAERKQLDYKFLSNVSATAKRIKMLDRIDNLNDLDLTQGFARVYATETEDLIKALTGTSDLALEAELIYTKNRVLSMSAK